MSFTKSAVAAAVAIAMAGTPVLARSAAPLSVASAVERGGAQTDHSNRFWDKNEYWVPLAIFAVVIIAIIALHKNSDDLPRSP